MNVAIKSDILDCSQKWAFTNLEKAIRKFHFILLYTENL